VKKEVVIISHEFFKKHFKLFTDKEHCVWTKTIVEDDLFKDDEYHAKLIKAKRKAEKELRDYEYNKRHNFK